jgi:hypothetical protein
MATNGVITVVAHAEESGNDANIEPEISALVEEQVEEELE